MKQALPKILLSVSTFILQEDTSQHASVFSICETGKISVYVTYFMPLLKTFIYNKI